MLFLVSKIFSLVIALLFLYQEVLSLRENFQLNERDVENWRETGHLGGVLGAHIEKCDRRNQKMMVRGVNITLSKFVIEDQRLWCGHARTLEIFALDSLIIDSNLKAGPEGLSVIMIARTWILVGNRIFDLRGGNGEPITDRATDGNKENPDGAHGTPGNPGKNGGNFLGIYDQLVAKDGSSLVINVSGGDGGNGQNGGRGWNGEAGENGKWEDFPSPYSELDSKMERLRHLEFNLLYGYRYKNYVVHGKLGTAGGNGGDGGMGGLGGYSGIANVTLRDNRSIGSETTSPIISVVKGNGRIGENGRGGNGGIGGKHGDGYQCTWRGVLADSIRWWDKCHYVPVSRVANELFAPGGLPGRAGTSFAGFRYPSHPTSDIFVNAVKEFNKFTVISNRI